METYIKLYRKILDNPDLVTDNNAFVMFTKMLLKVDRKTGSFTAGRMQLATLCNMKPVTAYRTTLRLVEAGLVTALPNTKYTTYTVVNWEKYQSKREKSEQLGNNLKHEAVSKVNTKQEKEKEKKIKNTVTSSSKELDHTHDWICELFDKSPARFKMTTQRKQKLRARIDDLTTSEVDGLSRVKGAFEAVAASNWHRGANDRGWRVDDDPYWVLANIERTEKWANINDEGDKPIKRNQTDLSKVEIPIS